MSNRIQFNVRLDKHADLHEAIKRRVDEQGITLNDFAIHAFQQALGWEVEQHPVPVLRTELEEMLAAMLAPMQQRLEELERQLGEPPA
jgi:hypothetical protein